MHCLHLRQRHRYHHHLASSRTRSLRRRYPTGGSGCCGGLSWNAEEPPGQRRSIYDFSISEAWFWGQDGLDHPTLLVIDTDADGVPDTQIAEDSQGDGIWDTIAPGFDTDTDNRPDVFVAADSEIAYELQRPVDLLQGSSRDPVTLTAVSQATSDQDSITATVLVAAATAAVLADFDAYAVGSQVIVEWRTAAEVGTIGFDLWRWRESDENYKNVTENLIPGLRHHLQGGTYRLVDPEVTVGERVVYILHEWDVWAPAAPSAPSI